MGDIVRPGGVPMRLSAEVIGTAPVERVDVLHGTQVAATFRNFAAADLGRRVRVLWQGAEYRGRGRETLWNGKLSFGKSLRALCPVNFLNPERKVQRDGAGNARLDFGDDRQSRRYRSLARRGARGTLSIETNVVSGEVDLASLADQTIAFDGGGLGRSSASIACRRTTGAGR